jgi:hypothetical protein
VLYLIPRAVAFGLPLNEEKKSVTTLNRGTLVTDYLISKGELREIVNDYEINN